MRPCHVVKAFQRLTAGHFHNGQAENDTNDTYKHNGQPKVAAKATFMQFVIF